MPREERFTPATSPSIARDGDALTVGLEQAAAGLTTIDEPARAIR